MKRNLFILATFALLAGATVPLQAKKSHDGIPPGKVYTFDEALGKQGRMEIYFPEGHDPSKPVPGVILFHGGAWKSGSLLAFRYHCHYLASRGLVAATSNYELIARKNPTGVNEEASPKTRCVASGKRAVRFLKANAAELGIDPDRLIAGGGSAGGHVALLSTTHTGLNDPRDSEEIDTSVVAYLLFNPAVNLKMPDDINLLNFVTPSEFPPAITFFGTSDTYLPGWEGVAEKLIAGGAPQIEPWYAAWEGHSFFDDGPWLNLCLIQADHFLNKLGLIEGEPTLPLPETGESLTRNPDLSLPPEVAKSEVYYLNKKYFHKKDCRRITPKKIDRAKSATAAEALEMGLLNCYMCRPLK